jgi:hypothetical protein
MAVIAIFGEGSGCGDLLPVVSAFFSSLCSWFGPLLTVDDTPTG